MSLPAVTVSQTPEDKFREYLASRPRPQRFTKPQQDMVRFIFKKHDHFDADQLIDEMKQAGKDVSRATIYRTLTKLVDAGLLRRLEIGPRTYYEHDYGYPDHEHMKCTKCKKMIEFQSGSLDTLVQELCRKHNFKLTNCTIVLEGLCEECNQAQVNKHKLDLI